MVLSLSLSFSLAHKQTNVHRKKRKKMTENQVTIVEKNSYTKLLKPVDINTYRHMMESQTNCIVYN